MFNLTSREQVVLNTWYGGEMKKGMPSKINHFMPLSGVASMHSSVNANPEGKDTCVFLGLSGTGRTMLSTDHSRLLIGDDEHGWSRAGERISIAAARRIAGAIQSGEVGSVPRRQSPCFNLAAPNQNAMPAVIWSI